MPASAEGPILSVDAPHAAAGPRLTASADYLLWWLQRDRPALPLLTTGTTGGGALNACDTFVLFRLSDLAKDTPPYSGGRFCLGLWATAEETCGLDVNGFFLEQRTSTFGIASDSNGSFLLSVPFFDVNPAINGPSFSQVSVPGALAGRVDAFSTTRLWGIDADLKAAAVRSENVSVDGLVGYRHLDLQERFGYTQTVTAITGSPLLSFDGNLIPATNTLQIADRFGTRNLFDGCDLGLRTAVVLYNELSMDLLTRIALGVSAQSLTVAGTTTQFSPGGSVVQTAQGGLFALPGANIGTSRHSVFSVLPEVAIRVRYAITPWLVTSIGYDFLYWSSVVRPGDQVSGTINSGLAPSQVPFANGGPVAPLPTFRRTDFTAQGLTFGVELRY
jgi:hypothetical protein